MTYWSDTEDLTGSSRHMVEFFEDEQALYTAVVSFSLPVLSQHNAVLLVVTKEHWTHLEQLFRGAALDLSLLTETGQLRVLDAKTLLASFMDGPVPSAERFLDAVGGPIREMGARFSKVCVFGGMVDLLWAENNRYGTLELECLWNDLMGVQDFTLLCGYAVDHFQGDEPGPGLRDVCAAHTHTSRGV